MAKLGDFGAAFRYATLFRSNPRVESKDDFDLGVFETIEVRAFACLMDDLLGMIAGHFSPDDDSSTGTALLALRDECWREDVPAERPRFAQIAQRLQKLAHARM